MVSVVGAGWYKLIPIYITTLNALWCLSSKVSYKYLLQDSRLL